MLPNCAVRGSSGRLRRPYARAARAGLARRPGGRVRGVRPWGRSPAARRAPAHRRVDGQPPSASRRPQATHAPSAPRGMSFTAWIRRGRSAPPGPPATLRDDLRWVFPSNTHRATGTVYDCPTGRPQSQSPLFKQTLHAASFREIATSAEFSTNHAGTRRQLMRCQVYAG